MAMAHPNPGVGKRKVSHVQVPLRRVTSAPPDVVRLRAMMRPLQDKETNAIRKRAKEAWSSELKRNVSCVTTYNGLHTGRCLDEPTQNRVRPSSKDRTNKPHPPTVFLVTRLKKVDGSFEPFQAAAKKYGGSTQKDLNKYVSGHETDIRRGMAGSPLQRPHTSISKMDRDRVKMQTLMGQVPAQATEAWIKLSNDRDQAAIMDTFKKTKARIKKELEATQPSTTRHHHHHHKRQNPALRTKPSKKDEEMYSSARWMKKIGPEESDAVRKLIECLRKAPPRYIPTEGPPFHITDLSPMFSTAPRRPYYDFQIHPEWHMPWHKCYETVRH